MSERTLWKGSPSQWTNFSIFLVCGLFFWLVIPIFIALYRYFQTKSKQIEITSERFIIKQGVFSKTTHQVEFYRIKDVVLHEPFLLRMVGLSSLNFISTDRVENFEPMVGMPDGEKLREEIRHAIEEVRERKKVYVRDY